MRRAYDPIKKQSWTLFFHYSIRYLGYLQVRAYGHRKASQLVSGLEHTKEMLKITISHMRSISEST
jgi:hypothetical protein